MQYPGTQRGRGGVPYKVTNCVDVYSVETVLLLLSCRSMWVKCISSLMRAKLHLRWKLRSKTRKEEIQLDQRQQRLNGTGKKRWWHCLFYHWGASARSCLEIWLALLSGPSCKLNVLSNASTLCFTDIMKPPLKVEPGRDEQRFPACQKSDWKSGHPPACQIGNPRPILTTKISRMDGFGAEFLKCFWWWWCVA